MNSRTWPHALAALSLAALLAVQSQAQNEAPPPDPTPQQGVEVQARGPVHEAYAEPTESRPDASVVVSKQPPAAIDELPPDEKPAGDNVVWVPGYWGWDEEQKDFLWISGFWRVPPPQRQWVPGHWQQVQDGWQWTAGFWATAGLEQIQYLPAPPPTLDTGASTPAPDENSIYAPGNWVYRESRYYWRPGFWVGFRPNWVWMPAHYVWSPAGYVFVEGYWDHPLEERGLLFAPVRIDPTVLTANWTYTPSYVVQPDFLIGALFVQPNHCHYYFGDYFEARYQRGGYVPWVDYRQGRGSYDPNFAYYRHRYNGDRSWETNLRELYTARREGTVERPPHTLGQQTTVLRNFTDHRTERTNVHKNINITNVQNVSVLTPVSRAQNVRVTNLSALGSEKTNVHKIDDHVIRLEKVAPQQQAEVHKAVAQYREAAQVRHQSEAKILTDHSAPVKATDPPRVVKFTLPQTPAAVIPNNPERPKPLPIKEAPKPPALPKHEDKPIPAHEPPRPAAPPRPQDVKPLQVPKPTPAPVPVKEPTPVPKQPVTPPAPPKEPAPKPTPAPVPVKEPTPMPKQPVTPPAPPKEPTPAPKPVPVAPPKEPAPKPTPPPVPVKEPTPVPKPPVAPPAPPAPVPAAKPPAAPPAPPKEQPKPPAPAPAAKPPAPAPAAPPPAAKPPAPAPAPVAKPPAAPPAPPKEQPKPPTAAARETPRQQPSAKDQPRPPAGAQAKTSAKAAQEASPDSSTKRSK